MFLTAFFLAISVVPFSSANPNCLQAKEQCINDPRCREAFAIFHKVCGLEMVACTTVTPTKCIRVLRTLQNYDFLAKCKCGQPHMDAACYTFKGTIFSHPCDNLHSDDQESLMVLPTCDRAYRDCTSETSGCFKDYVEFVNHCEFNKRDGYCEADDMEACHRAWIKIRHSKVFGCICPPKETSTSVSSQYYDSNYQRSGDSMTMIRGYNTERGKDCMQTYNETHRNPCLKPMDSSRATQIEDAQQTCHHAFRSCMEDRKECQPLLNDVMLWCEHTHCEPDRCRSALLNFYARVSISRRLEVAFCVCRQNDPDGQCLTAMRNLHPTCAQRKDSREERKCHEIAPHCRKDANCRARLEEYEKNCSADAVTGRCVVNHRACQFAVTRILGTELHATCVCKGTDFLHQRDCYSWQKLLWSNPCVIESHLSLQEELRRGKDLDIIFTKAPVSTTTPEPPRLPTTPEGLLEPYGTYGKGHNGPAMPSEQGPYGMNGDMRPSSGGPSEFPYPGRGGIVMPGNCVPGAPNCRIRGGGGGLMGPNGIRGTHIRKIGNERGGGGVYQPRPRNPFGRNSGIDPNTRRRWNLQNKEGQTKLTGMRENNRNQNIPRGTHFGGTKYNRPDGSGMIPPGGYKPYPKPGHNFQNRYQENAQSNYGIDEDKEYDNEVTTIPTTIAPTPEPRYCIYQENLDGKLIKTVRIPEFGRRRIHNSKECSNLCECFEASSGPEKQQLRCLALGCIRHRSCNTSSAQYLHSFPFYQAFRGECICYYGNFICQRPPKDTYTLGPGIYLLLGYSKDEMELLKPHTRADEMKALAEIETILIRKYGFKCNLKTKTHIGENIIAQAELTEEDQKLDAYAKQRIEKERCTKPLEDLSKKINDRHIDVSQNAYLSMFVLAEVHVNAPEAQTSIPSSGAAIQSTCIWGLLLFVSILFLCEKNIETFNSLSIFAGRIGKKLIHAERTTPGSILGNLT